MMYMILPWEMYRTYVFLASIREFFASMAISRAGEWVEVSGMKRKDVDGVKCYRKNEIVNVHIVMSHTKDMMVT